MKVLQVAVLETCVLHGLIATMRLVVAQETLEISHHFSSSRKKMENKRGIEGIEERQKER